MPRPALLLGALVLWLLAGCAAIRDPLAGATELRPGRPYEVMTPGMHYFTFTLAAPARVVLESDVFPGDMTAVDPIGELLDSEGRTVVLDRLGGSGSNFRIEERLAAGTWYLRVHDPQACFSVWRCDDDHRYSVVLTLEDDPE